MNLTGYKPNSKSLVQYFLPMTWLVTNLFQRLWYRIFYQWYDWLQTCFKDLGTLLSTNNAAISIGSCWTNMNYLCFGNFLIFNDTFLKLSSSFVVYFDQQTGAAHLICWSIYVTSFFNCWSQILNQSHQIQEDHSTQTTSSNQHNRPWILLNP